MNWLAHLFLAGPNPACQLGSVLPDLLSKPLLTRLPMEFDRGVAHHYWVDAFTDSHPVFRRSVSRIEPPLRRFGGILGDVFYDHFLSVDWQRFASVPLRQFVSEVYASFRRLAPLLPHPVQLRLQRMEREDWLGSYGDLPGIRETLGRMNDRFRRPVDLVPAVELLVRDYHAFHGDFAEFFPELIRSSREFCA
jgi:acyl carrier protein phosphodiesterase